MSQFDDLFGPLRGASGQFTQKPKKVEKSVPWEAKVIDGQYYVPLRQVNDLLVLNGVLPKVAEGIRRRVAIGPKKEGS